MRSTLQKASLFDVGVIWVIPGHSRGSDAGRHSRVKAIALQGALCLPFDSGYTFAWSNARPGGLLTRTCIRCIWVRIRWVQMPDAYHIRLVQCTSCWPFDEDIHQLLLGTYSLGPDARCIFAESRCLMLLVTGRGVPVASGEDIHRRESPRQRMPHAHLTSPLPGRGLGPVVDEPENVPGDDEARGWPHSACYDTMQSQCRYQSSQSTRHVSYPD